MITINVKSGKAESGLARLGRRLPTRTMYAIWEIAKRIEIEARAGAPYWHGNLQSSIIAKPETKNKITISAIFYWRFVEGGHVVHSIAPKLKGWIFQKAGAESYPMVSRALLAKGATPHPFMKPAIEQVRKEIHGILKKYLKS